MLPHKFPPPQNKDSFFDFLRMTPKEEISKNKTNDPTDIRATDSLMVRIKWFVGAGFNLSKSHGPSIRYTGTDDKSYYINRKSALKYLDLNKTDEGNRITNDEIINQLWDKTNPKP